MKAKTIVRQIENAVNRESDLMYYALINEMSDEGAGAANEYRYAYLWSKTFGAGTEIKRKLEEARRKLEEMYP